MGYRQAALAARCTEQAETQHTLRISKLLLGRKDAQIMDLRKLGAPRDPLLLPAAACYLAGDSLTSVPCSS